MIHNHQETGQRIVQVRVRRLVGLRGGRIVLSERRYERSALQFLGHDQIENHRWRGQDEERARHEQQQNGQACVAAVRRGQRFLMTNRRALVLMMSTSFHFE